MKKFLAFLCAICLCVGFGSIARVTPAEQTVLAQADWESLVDFTVEVEEGRDIRVLQISDTQIIAGEDSRSSGGGDSMWAYKEVQRHERFTEQVILNYKPDFIFIAGDVIYGKYDDNGEHLLRLIEFMDSFRIPWAPVMGNHDIESYIGIDWICEQYENSEYCLFKQRTLTGNGNYTVGIVQGGKLKRTFYMLDSNGSHTASQKSLSNGHTKTTAGFGDDQIAWYTESINAIKSVSPQTKFSFVFHIQMNAFVNAFAKYGFTNDKSCLPIDIDNHPDRQESDFGYIGAVFPTLWDMDNSVYNGIKALGVDSLFVGHEHCNSGSVVHDGIRFQYGQKSSTFDMANYLKKNGTIVGSYFDDEGEAIIGGTAIPIAEEDGSIVDPYIVYYEEGLSLERTFDFNGEDFDAQVKANGLNGAENVATKITEGAPSGYEGDVYKAQNQDFISVGFKFLKNLRFNNLSSLKIRLYVSDYVKGSPSISICNDEGSSVAQMDFPADSYGKWVDIDILPTLKTATSLVKNDTLLPFTLVYNCDYESGNTPEIYFDSVKIEYVSTLYQMDREIIPDPLGAFEESAVAQYKSHVYYRYTLSDFGQTEPWHLEGKDSKIYKVGDNGYSIVFNLTPNQFKDLNVTVLADETGKNGYCFSFMPNGISLDRPNGHPLNIFEYQIELGETVTLEVGLIKYVYNEQTGAGNGNVACLFATVNGEVIARSTLDLTYFQNRNYISISTFFAENDLTIESLNKVEYRTEGGKLLMKELSSGDIAVTQDKINVYSQGNQYSSVAVNGQAFTDGQILSNGVNTVTLALAQEPNEDLFKGALNYDITKTDITVGAGVYDGNAKTVAPIVKDGETLTEGIHYTLTYFRGENQTADLTSAGDIKVVIKGIGVYSGEIEKIYTISKKALAITTLPQVEDVLSSDDNMIYVDGLATGDTVAQFTLKRENCKIVFDTLQIKDENGQDVLNNYDITYNYAENHVYGEWTITKEPTQTEVGRRERVCTCGKKQIEEITEMPERPIESEQESESSSEPESETASQSESKTESKPESKVESAPKKKGCSSSVGGIPLACLGLVACFIIKRKKS